MKQLYFWLAFVNLIYCIATFVLIFLINYKTFEITKEWIIILTPLTLDLGFVFIIFYSELLGDKKNN